MGRKYKETLEREWKDKSTSDIKVKTLQLQADRNISNILKGKITLKKRRLK